MGRDNSRQGQAQEQKHKCDHIRDQVAISVFAHHNFRGWVDQHEEIGFDEDPDVNVEVEELREFGSRPFEEPVFFEALDLDEQEDY